MSVPVLLASVLVQALVLIALAAGFVALFALYLARRQRRSWLLFTRQNPSFRLVDDAQAGLVLRGRWFDQPAELRLLRAAPVSGEVRLLWTEARLGDPPVVKSARVEGLRTSIAELEALLNAAGKGEQGI